MRALSSFALKSNFRHYNEDVAAAHCERLLTLQRLAFKHAPKLRELALSNCGTVEKRAVLAQHLSR